MTDQQLTIAIAKLDEPDKPWQFVEVSGGKEICWIEDNGSYIHYHVAKNYLTYRNSIISVIEKQAMAVKSEFCHQLYKLIHGEQEGELDAFTILPLIMDTPKQLAIALVKACGKWEE